MPKRLKSYNKRDNRDVVRSAATLAITIAAIALLLPQAIQYVIVPVSQLIGPVFQAFGLPAPNLSDIEPKWGILTGFFQALESKTYKDIFSTLFIVFALGALLFEAAVFIRRRLEYHNGTWLGPKRVEGDPGGSAYLVSRHSALRKLLKAWDGKSVPKQSGLPVAYFNNKYWMLDYINLVTYGAPGSGKTRRVLLPTICAHIMAGDSVWCLDPKGEIRDYTEDFATQHGYHVVRVMVDDPVHSPDCINPLDAAIAFAESNRLDDAVAEVASISKIISPTKSKSSPHFDDSARSLCEGLILFVITNSDIPREAKNLTTVSAIVSFAGSDGATGLDRIRTMAQNLPDSHVAKSKLSQVANTGDEEASSIISTLTNKLNDYVDARVSKMLYRNTFSIEDMAHEKTIIYLSFSTALGNYGKLVTTLVTNAISALRREAARQGGQLSKECYFILEEMAQLERIETIYTDAGIMRGEGIHMLLIIQEKNQLLTKYSKEEAASLTGCCDDMLVLSVNELEVAKEISDKIGNYPALSQSSNRSRNSNNGGTSSSGTTTSSQPRALIKPDELLKWGPEIGNLLIGHGGTYALPSPELSKTFVNELLGLGDNEFNNQLRAKKKASRPEVNIDSAPIWLPDKTEITTEKISEPTSMRRNYNPLRI